MMLDSYFSEIVFMFYILTINFRFKKNDSLYYFTLANREDPDEMLHRAALFANLKTKTIFRAKNTSFYRNFDMFMNNLETVHSCNCIYFLRHL